MRKLAKLLTDPPPAIKLEAPRVPVEVDTVYMKMLLVVNEFEIDVT